MECGFLFLGACGSVAWLLLELTRAANSVGASSWRLTKGELQHWSLGHSENGEDTNFEYRHIEYTYSVAGKTYHGRNIGYGFPTSMESMYVVPTVEEIFRQSPVLAVRYNPENHGQSVLAAGFRAYHAYKLVCLLIPSVFLVLGTLVCLSE